eukprot:3120923-Rhodomonas_salina.1
MELAGVWHNVDCTLEATTVGVSGSRPPSPTPLLRDVRYWHRLCCCAISGTEMKCAMSGTNVLCDVRGTEKGDGSTSISLRHAMQCPVLTYRTVRCDFRCGAVRCPVPVYCMVL